MILATHKLAIAFQWVWQASLAGSVVMGLVLLIQILLRRSMPVRLRYLLWCCVLVRLLLPVSPGSRISVFNLWSESRGAKVLEAPSLSAKSSKTLPEVSVHLLNPTTAKPRALPNPDLP